MAKKNRNDVEKEQAIQTLVLSEDGKSLTAFWLRIFCGCGLNKKFNPIYALENVIPKLDSSFNYLIIEKDEWTYGDFVHAFYTPAENTITIRCDIYEQALEGLFMAQITITHEIVHYFQSVIVTFLQIFQCIKFKTELCEAGSEQMIRHEEQTDSITYLVLSPRQLTEGKTENEIFEFFIEKPIKLLVPKSVRTLRNFKRLLFPKVPKQIAS